MKFFILTIALANGFTVNSVNGIAETYDSRDLWYGGEKLTITAYEKQGIGYLRMKGVHNWGLKWNRCTGSVQYLIRYGTNCPGPPSRKDSTYTWTSCSPKNCVAKFKKYFKPKIKFD